MKMQLGGEELKSKGRVFFFGGESSRNCHVLRGAGKDAEVRMTDWGCRRTRRGWWLHIGEGREWNSQMRVVALPRTCH
jgi:hypothetical protein